ncbi:hypothetical protein GCM10010168_23940 [Actinoplanes ianthinogenes]|uniref:Uncharacterized protein n=1 Tax=Actinoplanes ianthinogenes TaxID=122358 RepID=A0ABN6CSB9_9ACTN|nr:hypothetical protein Aiant_86920 [Actinoplanes ianthinogenes]GGR05919.1 hypothetical protein GCM10010168_23940 [Actinoplanes ianthinogenes]
MCVPVWLDVMVRSASAWATLESVTEAAASRTALAALMISLVRVRPRGRAVAFTRVDPSW